MVYKKYVTRKGKKHGPYYYESVRQPDGKIKAVYLGSTKPTQRETDKKLRVALRGNAVKKTFGVRSRTSRTIKPSFSIHPKFLILFALVVLFSFGAYFGVEYYNYDAGLGPTGFTAVPIQDQPLVEETLSLYQAPAEIGKPVEWIQRVKVKAGSDLDWSQLVPNGVIVEDISPITPKITGMIASHDSEIEYDIKFTTSAPEKHETVPILIDSKWKKKVEVSSDASVHYYNTLSSTNILEEKADISRLFSLNPRQVKISKDVHLYLLKNNERIDITENPDYNVELIDTDFNGETDTLQWTVPRLSEEEFEVEVEIIVLNVQSYPETGGNWTVPFNTTGTELLNITKDSKTFAEISFEYLKCGDELIEPIIQGPSIVVENWNCDNQIAEIEHTVNIGGDHEQHFQFGTAEDWAYNMFPCFLNVDCETCAAELSCSWCTDTGLGGGGCVDITGCTWVCLGDCGEACAADPCEPSESGELTDDQLACDVFTVGMGIEVDTAGFDIDAPTLFVSGTLLIRDGSVVYADSISLSGSMEINGSSTLKIQSLGFGTSNGVFNLSGGESAVATITTNQTLIPYTTWDFGENTLTLFGEYANFSFYDSADVGTLNVNNSYFENSSGDGVTVGFLDTLLGFANNTVQGSQDNGLELGKSITIFENITVLNSTNPAVSIAGTAIFAEFNNSQFESTVFTSGGVISANHNDTANDYHIWSTTGEGISKSTITNDFGVVDNVFLDAGFLDINEVGSCSNLTIDLTSGGPTGDSGVNITGDNTLTMIGNITLHNSNISIDNGTITEGILNGTNFTVSGNGILISEYGTFAGSSTSFWNISKYVNVSGVTATANATTINVTYADSDVSGEEANLSMYHYTPLLGWTLITNSTVNTTTNNVIATDVLSFSLFGPMGSNGPPNQTNPLLKSASGNNLSADNLTCTNQSTSDPDGDEVQNIFNWYKDGTQQLLLNAPFANNTNSTDASQILDYSTFKNHGQAYANTFWNSTGVIGGSHTFDGTGDYISFGSDASLDFSGDDFTAEVWVKLETNNNDYQGILTKQTSTNGFGLITDNLGKLALLTWSGGAGFYTVTNAVQNPSQWYHLVGLRRNGISYLYLDGVEQDDTDEVAFTDSTLTDVVIGRFYGATNNFYLVGSVDEARIYDYGLSAKQVLARYESTKDGFSVNETIVGEDTSSADVWTCEVTPVDRKQEGTPLNSTPLTINTVPTITFVVVTPNNESKDQSWIYVNITIDEAGSSANLDWTSLHNTSSINYSMSQVENSNQKWGFNVTDLLTHENYTFIVWANDTSEETGKSPDRWVYILNNEPTQLTPNITSFPNSNNYTTENLTCTNNTVADVDGDGTQNIYNWYINGSPLALLNMPFDLNNTSTVLGGAKDYSNYNINGTLGNGVAASVPTWTTGKLGGAYDFDGSNDYIETEIDARLNPTTITVSSWFNAESGGFTAQKPIVHKAFTSHGAPFYQYSTFLYDKTPLLKHIAFYVTVDNTWYIGAAVANSGWGYGAWHHLVGTYDGETVKVYLDGELKASDETPSGDMSGYSTPVTIGAFTNLAKSSTYVFRGLIDQVQIFDRAFSPAQVMRLYNETRFGFTNNATIVSQETTNSDVWECEITPNDNRSDGTAVNSSALTVTIPDVTNPVITFVEVSPNNESLAQPWIYVNVTVDESVIDATVEWLPEGGTATNYSMGQVEASDQKWGYNVTSVLNHTNISFRVWANDSVPNLGVSPERYVYISNSLPTQTVASLVSWPNGNNLSLSENLTVTNQTTADADGDLVTNIFNWYLNGTSISVLNLPFDTNNTTGVTDYSSHGNDGAITDAKWTGSGKVGGGYDFDGTGDYLTVASLSPAISGTVTVSMWVYWDGYSSDTDAAGRLTLFDAQNPGDDLWLNLNESGDSKFNVYFGDLDAPGYHHSTSVVTQNSWHHLAASWDGTNVKLYINGTLDKSVETAVSGTFALDTSSFKIGARENFAVGADFYFNGIIDDVRIYDRALSDTQILQIYNDTHLGLSNNATIVSQETTPGDVWQVEVTPNDNRSDGVILNSTVVTIQTQPFHINPWLNSTSLTNLTSENLTATNNTTSDVDGNPVTNIFNWYVNGTSWAVLNMPFETNNSTGATDYGGNNDGTHGAGAASPTWGAGQVGGAYTFDGGDYISIANEGNFDFVNSVFSVEGWFKTSNTDASRRMILAKGAAANYQWDVELQTNHTLTAYFSAPDGSTVLARDSPEAVNDGNWHHFVIVYDTRTTSENIKLYLDSDEKISSRANVSATEDYGNGDVALMIGARDPGSPTLFFDGSLDNIRIYSGALSWAQINQSYQEQVDSITNNATIVSQETFVDAVWQCEVTPTDTVQDGTVLNSSATTVLVSNVPPGLPAQWSVDEALSNSSTPITNRRPVLVWNNSTDTNGDALTYELVIDNDMDFSSPEINVSGLENTTLDNSTNYTSSLEADVDDVHAWKVRAWDGTAWGQYGPIWWYEVQSSVSISMAADGDTAAFGDMYAPLTNSTLLYPVVGFPVVSNDGNCDVNITVTGTDVWDSDANPTANFVFQTRENETDSIEDGELTTWTQVPATSAVDHIGKLLHRNYTNTVGNVSIHINITVPYTELAGSKSSTLTFTAEKS